MNIVLTGYMASGKSTVGKEIAQICDRKFADTDAIIEQKCGMTISNIFSDYGEEYFRKTEKEVIADISTEDGLVIATGGGAVLDKENIENLRENGVIVNLNPDEDVICARLTGGDSTRPLANGKTVEEILERFNRRREFYNNCDIQIDVTLQMVPEDTAKLILRKLEGRI